MSRPPHLGRLAIVLACLLIVPWAGQAQDEAAMENPASTGYKIVVHADNPLTSLSAKALSRVFLKKTRRWDEDLWGRRVNVSPFDLPEKSEVRRLFTRAIHDKSTSAIKSYWQREIFSGREVPPTELPSDEEMIQRVADEEGAIGYVSAGAELPETLKVLKVTDE